MNINNDDKEQTLLKTSLFGGFEKHDVLSYIDKLKEENEKNIVDLKGSMEEMEKASNDLKEQIGSFEDKISSLESQLSQKGGKISELTGQVDSLKEKVKQKEKSCEDAKRELTGQKEQNRHLNLKAQTFEYKAKRYDEMSGKLGEVLISARENADEIINKADAKALEITQNAVDVSNKIAEEMRSLKCEISDMRENLKKLTDSFANRLNDVDNAIDNVLACDVLNQCSEVLKSEETKIPVPSKEIAEYLADNKKHKKEIRAVAKNHKTGESFFRRAAKVAE